MKKLSHFMNESLLVPSTEFINECVIAARKLTIDANGKLDATEGSSYVLIKHRDRAYRTNITVVRKLVNNVEILFLRDLSTEWSEGINSAGTCIINSSLSLADESIGKDKSKNKDKDKSDDKDKSNLPDKFAADGEKIIKALSFPDIEDSVHFAKTWKSGIFGNTLISNDDTLYTISSTSMHPAVISKLDGLETVVFTNHSEIHADAGYTEGPSFKSSITRKKLSEEILSVSNTPEEMAKNMRKQKYGRNSQLNPLRSTDSLATRSQMILDPKNLHMHLVILKEFSEAFRGLVDETPVDYEPKIKFTFEEI